MKKIFVFALIFMVLLSSCGRKVEIVSPKEEIIESETEIKPESEKTEKEPEEIAETDRDFYCVTNSDAHEENLSFKLEIPENWKISGSSTVDFNGSKVAEFYMKCGENYEDWLGGKTDEHITKEIGGKTFFVFSYEQSMLNYNNEDADFKEMNSFEISEYEFHNGKHEYRFVLFENKDKDEEYTAEFEKALETFVPAESYYFAEEGKLSGMIHPMIDTEKGAEICKGELVSVSMSVPEGWEQGVLEEEEKIYGITFTMPWDDRHYANFVIYKDTGTTYDDLLAMNSLWVGIDEYTYHEVSGDFFEGSYIHFDYPRKNLGDEEDPIRTYSRFYQLKSEGYVVSVNIGIRLDEEWNAIEEDEKICDEFISSIKIG